MNHEKIIVAMDGMGHDESLHLASEVAGLVFGFKFHDLLLRQGIAQTIADFKPFGKIFTDLKFHDIPETVRKEVAALVDHGADLITVHASGGQKMLEAAVEAGGEKVVAVTILTSLSPTDSYMIYHITPEEGVRGLAEIAGKAGVSNIVCSPREISLVKEAAPNARIITPGIRGPHDKKDDQQRTLSAREAVDAGAGLLVIGRPITKAPHPREALEAILRSLNPSG